MQWSCFPRISYWSEIKSDNWSILTKSEPINVWKAGEWEFCSWEATSQLAHCTTVWAEDPADLNACLTAHTIACDIYSTLWETQSCIKYYMVEEHTYEDGRGASWTTLMTLWRMKNHTVDQNSDRYWSLVQGRFTCYSLFYSLEVHVVDLLWRRVWRIHCEWFTKWNSTFNLMNSANKRIRPQRKMSYLFFRC